MKIKFDGKKGSELVSNILQKTSDFGEKTLNVVQKSVSELTEKNKQDSYERRLKKYNPLFPEIYQSDNFNCPNMIIIVDDAVRRGIDVCEGAIGWLGNESGMEVLFLYDEAISMSGINFVPSPSCDAAYYVDSYDRNRFIRVDCIFSKAHEEKMAELKNIAYSLGAKSCSIEISESNTETKKSSAVMDIGGKLNIKIAAEASTHNSQSSSYQSTTHRSGRITAQFEGSNTPKRPKLKWFSKDDTIKRLIDMRCKNGNAIKSEVLELSGSSSATMSKKTAKSIDGVLNKHNGFRTSTAMESQAATENESKLIFSIEF